MTATAEVDWDAVEALSKAINQDGHILKDFVGVSDSEMSAIYAVGCQEMDAGRFADAELRFAMLCRLDHWNSKYWLGLGVSRQLQKRFKDAITAYQLAGLHDVENPIPGLRAAECYLAMGDMELALSGAKAALHWSEDKPEYADTATRAAAIIEAIKRQKGTN